MKFQTNFNPLLLLSTISLLAQFIAPVPVQAETCLPGRCVYLPVVSQPPFLVVWHDPPVLSGRTTLSYSSYIHNNSPFALKDIVLLVEEYGDAFSPPFTSTYTVTLSQRPEIAISVLDTNEIAKFTFVTSQFMHVTPVVNLNALTWAIAPTTESKPLSVTSVLTKTFTDTNGKLATRAIFAFRNSYAQKMRNAEIAAWFIDSSRQSSCTFLVCYGRDQVQTLLPGENYTFTTEWQGTGYIPIEAIRVSAHGVISP